MLWYTVYIYIYIYPNRPTFWNLRRQQVVLPWPWQVSLPRHAMPHLVTLTLHFFEATGCHLSGTSLELSRYVGGLVYHFPNLQAVSQTYFPKYPCLSDFEPIGNRSAWKWLRKNWLNLTAALGLLTVCDSLSSTVFQSREARRKNCVHCHAIFK